MRDLVYARLQEAHRLKKTVMAVCVDMYDGYVNAAKAVFKNRATVVDHQAN